jgi:hypothetical protein
MTNNDLQNITQKSKHRPTRNPLKTGGELGCSGRVGSFCCICGTRWSCCVVTNPVISHRRGKDQIMSTTNGTYPWSQFICSTIPAYGVYLSQLMLFSRASGSHQYFLDRGLLLTRKLLNQGFLVVKLKSSLRKYC